MYFLRIEDNNFGFILDGLHEIRPTDIKVTDEEYTRFFELQGTGKQFKLRDIPVGNGLFDYLEEFTPEVITNAEPSMEDRLKAVEMAMLEVL